MAEVIKRTWRSGPRSVKRSRGRLFTGSPS